LSKEDELQSCPLLIFANKQDKNGCLSTDEIFKKIKNLELKQNFHVSGCSGISGEGLFEGLEWISKTIK
jgi:signal recognition particle receptor subunit beta